MSSTPAVILCTDKPLCSPCRHLKWRNCESLHENFCISSTSHALQAHGVCQHPLSCRHLEMGNRIWLHLCRCRCTRNSLCPLPLETRMWGDAVSFDMNTNGDPGKNASPLCCRYMGVRDSHQSPTDRQIWGINQGLHSAETWRNSVTFTPQTPRNRNHNKSSTLPTSRVTKLFTASDP
jgi:hypothetical protein